MTYKRSALDRACEELAGRYGGELGDNGQGEACWWFSEHRVCVMLERRIIACGLLGIESKVKPMAERRKIYQQIRWTQAQLEKMERLLFQKRQKNLL